MRNPLKRHYGQGDLHFVTFSCYRRRPLLGTVWVRDRFVKILDEVRRRHKFRLVGYVVMPEHVHLLMSGVREQKSFENSASAEAEGGAGSLEETKGVEQCPIVFAVRW